MANNDPVLIPYVIQEGSLWYVAYKEKNPFVPEITVSAKGIANHMSEEINDGYDFGPDSYNPSVTSGVPLTQTSGLQEAVNYGGNNNDVDIDIVGEIAIGTTVVLPAGKNVSIRGFLYNTNGNGANNSRGASAIVPTTSMSGYLIDSKSTSLKISGILFGGYDISTISDSSTVFNPNVNGITFSSAHTLIDYCKFTFLNTAINVGGSGGPRMIAHSHFTYCGNYNVITQPECELVLDSDEWFTNGSKNSPPAYLECLGIDGNTYDSPTIRISNGNFANTYLCTEGAISYGNGAWIQIANTFIDGGYAFAPLYLNSNANAGHIKASNLIFSNNYTGTFESLINITSGTALSTVIDINNFTYVNPPSSGISWYFVYQQSSGVYCPNLVLTLNMTSLLDASMNPNNNTTLSNNTDFYKNIDISYSYLFQTTVSGTTAGSFTASQSKSKRSYKKVLIYLDGYENDSTTAQTYTFPVPFSTVAVITNNSASVPGVSTSLTEFSIAPDTTTAYTGIIVIEGY